MEEIKKIRKDNLVYLINKQGGRTSFSDSTGISKSYISHVLNGRRNIGNKLCKKIEGNLSLENDWMEHRHDN